MASQKLMMLLGALSVVSCAGQNTRGQADGVADVVRRARNNGAYQCAPKELALAEANLQRTYDELDLGNLIPAKDHLVTAETNARAAFDKSPPEKCAAVKLDDADQDGCVDAKDRCPKEPEDRDGFEDDDCCPDLDNDRDGLPDSVDACPNEAEDKDGIEDENGCPDLDNDQDGVVDGSDRCPEDGEDWDGFEDNDGCPEDDNDGDRIADLKDKCPNQPGPAATGGCPKNDLVVVTADKIELRQMVYFETRKTRILPRSYALLNEVARVLTERKTMQVRIEGHTDSQGNDGYNLRLSQGRADSVRAYLAQQGIDVARMESVGFGETKPIASNRTRGGRSLNRRVEFFITKQ